jgi:hypothetical protein
VGRGKKTSRRGKTVERYTGDIARVTVSVGYGRGCGCDCGCDCGWGCDPGYRTTREEAVVGVVVDHRIRAGDNRGVWGNTSDRDTAVPPVGGRRELEEADASARPMRKIRTTRRP